MLDKKNIFNLFLENLNKQIDGFQFALDELSISVLNETKNTAGDKHETALSMLQLEQSQIAKHLYDSIDLKTSLLQTELNISNEVVKKGSLVKTNNGYYFLSIACPKISFENNYIYGISIQSPLGNALLGKAVNDKIHLLGKEHIVEEII